MRAGRVRRPVLFAVVCTAATACASVAPVPPPVHPGETAPVLNAVHAWWRAYTVGDTARVASLAAPGFSLILSNAERLDRAAAIQEASTRGDSSRIRLEWSGEDARFFGKTAVVTSELAEWVGAGVVRYRYMTVLDRRAEGWRLVAAQSTRVPVQGEPVRVSVDALRAYAGRYRVPSGATIDFAVRDSVLTVTEPSGLTRPLVPVGPAVFEFDAQVIRRSGLIRFVFERDEQGRVAGVSRIAANGVLRFPRVP